MNKFYDHLDNYLVESNSIDAFPDDLQRLTKNSLVAYNKEKPYDYKSIVVQPEFLRTLHKDDIFEELLHAYPMKVQRPDGITAFLRKDKRLCKDLYYIITKDDKVKHDHIMLCLTTELTYRKNNDSMQWMKTLSNWLSGKEWENFEDLVAYGTSTNNALAETYGTNLM